MKAIGYIRVSTDEQASSGLGLAAQRSAIEAESTRRGWTLVDIIEDAGLSGRKIARPGLNRAIDMLRSGEADILVASKLDRVSRSALDFLTLAQRAAREGWQMRVLDADLDTSTPMGKFAVGILALVAELERDLISQRTKDALAAKRRQGVKLGRKTALDTATRRHILEMRANGASYREIAKSLNDEQLPTGQGAKVWHASSVRSVVLSSGPEPAPRSPSVMAFERAASSNPNVLIAIHVGDFYEFYGWCATLVSSELELTLAHRLDGDNQVPMVGIPYHSIEKYLSKLVNAGYKVALVGSASNNVFGKNS